MDIFDPELGQLICGASFHYFKANEQLLDVLDDLANLFHSLFPKEDNPFWNTGNQIHFKEKSGEFIVRAYDWNEDDDVKPNLEWQDVEIFWYKHCTRGVSINKDLSDKEIELFKTELTKIMTENKEWFDKQAENIQKDPGRYRTTE
jgi:hypothetical protein